MSSKKQNLIKEQNKGIIMISCVTIILITVIGLGVLFYDRGGEVKSPVSDDGIVQDRGIFRGN